MKHKHNANIADIADNANNGERRDLLRSSENGLAPLLLAHLSPLTAERRATSFLFPAIPAFSLPPLPAFACFVLSLCVKDYVSLFAERFFSITP
jgi:hypothetical protein